MGLPVGRRRRDIAGAVCQTAALGLIVSGGLAVAGWTGVAPGLRQGPLPFWSMHYSAGLAFVATGSGLFLLQHGRQRWAVLAGVIVAVLGALALAQTIGGFDLGVHSLLSNSAPDPALPSQMAPNAALCFLLSGIYLVAASVGSPSRMRSPVLGLVSSVVLGVAAMAIIGYLGGVEEAYVWQGVAGMSPLAAVDFALLSTSYLLLAVQQGRRGGLPDWSPLASGALLLILGFGLWLALNSREEGQVRGLINGRTRFVADEIESLMEARASALGRMAARWEMSGGTPRNEWEADAYNYVISEPGFEFLLWADRGATVRWVIPSGADLGAIDRDLRSDPYALAALDRATSIGENALTEPLELQDGDLGFLLLVPVTVDDEFDGLLIGVINAEGLLGSLLPSESMDDVSIAIFDEDGHQLLGPSLAGALYDRYRNVVDLQLLNESWRLEVWPKELLLDAATTAIPEITLAMGAVVAILLALTFLFAQRSRLRAEELEQTVDSRTVELQESIDALAESERRYSQLYEFAPDMFVSIDPAYATIVRCNQTLADTIGVAREEIVGRPITALYHPDCHAAVIHAFGQFLEFGEVQDTALKLLHRDGSTTEVLVNDSAIRDPQGKILFCSSVIRDVTALKTAEHERDRLLQAEREQRQISETLARVALALSATLELESLVELICKESVSLFDTGSAFVWLVEDQQLVGRAGYGLGRENFIGTTVPIDDPDTLGARVIRDRRPIFVNHAQTLGGANPELVKLFHVQSILGVPLLKGLRPIGALMILDTEDPERFGSDDLAMASVLGSHVAVAVENARLYEQERALAQMKDDFIAHVSHELRTPLHTLRGFIQLLRSGKVAEPEVQQDFLARAAHDADRLTEQVSELLEAAQIDANGLRLDYELVDVGIVVQQTLDSVKIIADDRGVELQNLVPPQGMVIQSEERRLRQVVRNLVENAVQFSEAGSSVVVDAANGAGELRLTVRDHGPGIPPQALDKLFDRFYQLENPARRERGGVGLGLYITRMIVEAHGGRIEVESAVGKGSTFQAILPRVSMLAVEDGKR